MSPAPTGNEFWKARAKHGADLIFSSPSILWEACCEYFEYVASNPWYKADAIKGGDRAGEIIYIPTMRPFTFEELYTFLGTNRKTFDLYEAREDFIPITTQVRQIIYTQKYNGAVVGAFNPNIISRDLGLTEKQEITKTTTKVSFKEGKN